MLLQFLAEFLKSYHALKSESYAELPEEAKDLGH